MTVSIIFWVVFNVIMLIGNYRWKKALKRREQIMKEVEKMLAKAVLRQNEQVKTTQHILNGQKLRFFAMNKQAADIEKTLEEVRNIASSFERNSKGSKRRN